MWRSLVLDAGLDKLQALLLAMVEGDEDSLPQAMEASGLPDPPGATVFRAGTRAGMRNRPPREGDEVSLPQAMEVSGLPAPQCEAVFEALTRAGLMIRSQGDGYVRKHLSN